MSLLLDLMRWVEKIGKTSYPQTSWGCWRDPGKNYFIYLYISYFETAHLPHRVTLGSVFFLNVFLKIAIILTHGVLFNIFLKKSALFNGTLLKQYILSVVAMSLSTSRPKYLKECDSQLCCFVIWFLIDRGGLCACLPGGFVDSADVAPPPTLWEIPVDPPPLFTDCEMHIPVPHSYFLGVKQIFLTLLKVYAAFLKCVQ